MSEKKKLIVSFSGGRTSAYMMWWLYNEWEDRDNWEMVTVFANTGKEVEGTLFFVDECSQEWGIPIVWVEAVRRDVDNNLLSKKGWKTAHKIVSYETASRNGEPFEELIQIGGIPSSSAPFCSQKLKRLPIESYAKSIGFNDCKIAIGIRVDESRPIDRDRCLYPLIDLNPISKRRVLEWWGKQSFNLNIHPDDGNCDNCWKKDMPRLCRNMIRNPSGFNWWKDMEDKYGHIQTRDGQVGMTPPFYFYRGNKSVFDIRELAKMSQAELKQITMFDPIDGCSESCEVF